MKIKVDFVSNSSSTSFVYISEDMLTEAEFFEAAGVAADSPVAPLFTQMYYDLVERIERGQELREPSHISELSDQDRFTPEVMERIKAALSEGKRVIASELSSENNLTEMLMACEIFEITSDKFYINAYDNYW